MMIKNEEEELEEMVKIEVTHSYENTFTMFVPVNATGKEIFDLIQEEDEGLGGDWYTEWDYIEEEI